MRTSRFDGHHLMSALGVYLPGVYLLGVYLLGVYLPSREVHLAQSTPGPGTRHTPTPDRMIDRYL